MNDQIFKNIMLFLNIDAHTKYYIFMNICNKIHKHRLKEYTSNLWYWLPPREEENEPEKNKNVIVTSLEIFYLFYFQKGLKVNITILVLLDFESWVYGCLL